MIKVFLQQSHQDMQSILLFVMKLLSFLLIALATCNIHLNFSCNNSYCVLILLPEWFAYLGHQANSNEPGSPYAITFRSKSNDSSGMMPMNVTAYSCVDSSLGCSCGDCPSSSVCFDSLPPAPHVKQFCSIKIVSLKVIHFGYNYL